MEIVIQNRENASAECQSAIEKLKKAGGGSLVFEGGEYHFFEQPDSRTGIFLKECENITVRGNGATFVIRQFVSPIQIHNCKNITVEDVTFTTFATPYVPLKIVKKAEDCFIGRIDPAAVDWSLEKGGLAVNADGVHYFNHHLSLHAIDKLDIKYLFVGGNACTDNLPAKFMYTDAEVIDGNIKFTYRDSSEIHCPYAEGEEVGILFDGSRARCVVEALFSENIKLKNVTIHRGGGMGIVVKLCKDIHIDGYKMEKLPGDLCTTTADALYFVNCSGLIRIENSRIAHTMDDGLNVHGNYFLVQKIEGDTIITRRGYGDGSGFCPFRVGHRLDFIDRATMQTVGSAEILAIEEIGGSVEKKLTVKRTGACYEGLLMDDMSTRPDLELVNNYFYDYPNLRIIGGGKLLIEGNTFEKGVSGLFSYDLNKYWYESGKLGQLIVRNNTYIDACYKRPMPGAGCIRVGVDGTPDAETPPCHDTVIIEGNKIYGDYLHCIRVAGVKNLTVKDNLYEDKPVPANMVMIDGKLQG